MPQLDVSGCRRECKTLYRDSVLRTGAYQSCSTVCGTTG
jgi:hypothetical protein